MQWMHISTVLLSAKSVNLRIDGGAWSCEYPLHFKSTWMNVKLDNFWTFFRICAMMEVEKWIIVNFLLDF